MNKINYHCDKCGQPMEFRAKPTEKYSVFTGTPTQDEWRVCPEWRPRIFGDNGHAWRYQGQNPIVRPDHFYPDPGLHQSPPRPPALAVE